MEAKLDSCSLEELFFFEQFGFRSGTKLDDTILHMISLKLSSQEIIRIK
jgi:hypothetical protein